MEALKKNQMEFLELKNSISKILKSLQRISSRVEMTKESVNLEID